MTADRLLTNCRIYSVDESGKKQTGDLIAIKDGKILFAGFGKSPEDFDGSPEIIDCGGNTVLPGLCDAHCHPAAAATLFNACDLYDVGADEYNDDLRETVLNQYIERLKQHVEVHGADEIIKGIGWDYAYFKNSSGTVQMPTRHDIDKVCCDKPVILDSYCGHYCWVNTRAIELAGLDENLPEISSGIVYKEADGYPEGVFQEQAAINLIKEGLDGADYSVDQYKEALRRYQRECANCYGITMVQDCMCTENAKQAYKELALNQELTVRVRGVHVIDGATAEKDFQEMLASRDQYHVNELFQINTAKFFMETGFCILKQEGCPDIPEELQGTLNFTEEEATAYMRKSMEEGYQIHCHAMGDASVKLAVDAITEAKNGREIGTGRDAIAHLMLIPEGYIEKIGALGLVCSCQPRWALWDAEFEHAILPSFGAKRALNQYPIKRFMDAGCVVAYGSDFPVTLPANPFHWMQCAVTRSVFAAHPDYDLFKDKKLGNTDAPDLDCVTLQEAVKSSTFDGAYELFLEDTAGSIDAGKSADLAILNCDIEKIGIDELYRIEVEKTIFRGEIVYDAQQD